MNKDEHRAWRNAVFHADLSATQRLVLLALETFTDYPAGTNAHPGIRVLAQMCDCHEITANRALIRAVDLGLIAKTERGNRRLGKADVYRITQQQSRVMSDDQPTFGTDYPTAQTGLPNAGVLDYPTLELDHQTKAPNQSTNPVTPKEIPLSPSLRSGDIPQRGTDPRIESVDSRATKVNYPCATPGCDRPLDPWKFIDNREYCSECYDRLTRGSQR